MKNQIIPFTHTIIFHGRELCSSVVKWCVCIYVSKTTLNTAIAEYIFCFYSKTHTHTIDPVYPYPNNVYFPPFHSIQCRSAYIENYRRITSYWSAHNLGLYKRKFHTDSTFSWWTHKFQFHFDITHVLLSGRPNIYTTIKLRIEMNVQYDWCWNEYHTNTQEKKIPVFDQHTQIFHENWKFL